MAFDEPTKSAAVQLRINLRLLPYVEGVGIGDERGQPILIVYVRRLPKKHDNVPQTWDNLPVRLRLIGKVSPGGKSR